MTMLLKDKFFTIESFSAADGAAQFQVRLLPGCDVYRGHFPGHPVAPGVCNIEMVKECFLHVIGSKPRITTIDRCRFTAVASPDVQQHLTVDLRYACADGTWTVEGSLADDQRQYMDFKLKMTAEA